MIQFTSESGDRYEDIESLFYSTAILFIMLSVCECIYFLCYDHSPIWFCMPDTVGWLFTILDYIIFGVLLFAQIMAFMSLIAASNYHGYRTNNFQVGYYGWIAGIIAILVTAFFFKRYLEYVIIGVLVVQIIQIGVFVYYNIKDSGSWWNLIFTILLYTVGSIATVIALFNFIALTIIVVIGYIVLRAITSGSEQCCGNCVTYSNGYCSYRQTSVSSGAHCNKYIGR